MNALHEVTVYSVVSDSFRFGFVIMARTLKQKNPEYHFTFKVLFHPELCPLGFENRKWLEKHVPGVSFVQVDLSGYDQIFRLRDTVFNTPKRLWAAFLILEAFADDSPGHVICLDSDMICLGKLQTDILRRSGFAAVEARKDDGTPRGFFNTGVMAIGPDCRGPSAYARILATNNVEDYNENSGRADQALLSLIYHPKNADCLPWRYNITKRQTPAQGVEVYLERMDAVFFHYVGAKPWHVSLDQRDVNDHEAVALWDRVVEEHLDAQEQLEYFKDWRDSSRALARAFLAEEKPRRRSKAKRVKRLRQLARKAFKKLRPYVFRS